MLDNSIPPKKALIPWSGWYEKWCFMGNQGISKNQYVIWIVFFSSILTFFKKQKSMQSRLLAITFLPLGLTFLRSMITLLAI